MASPDPYKEKGPHRGPFSYLRFICIESTMDY